MKLLRKQTLRCTFQFNHSDAKIEKTLVSIELSSLTHYKVLIYNSG